ncbi:MAG: hypothetical protein GY842_24505 [bacterium]|nr:hypothetical protein [bacterium]
MSEIPVPRTEVSYSSIGSALAQLGQDERAVGYFRQAAEPDHWHTLPRWNLFRLHRNHEWWREGRWQLTQFVATDPKDFRASDGMGFVCHRLGDADGVLHFWPESLRENPNRQEIIQAPTEACGDGRK